MRRTLFVAYFCLVAGLGFEASGQTIRAVAIVGDHAPGTPDSVTFTAFSPPQINDLGDVSFAASLRGPGVTMISDSGLWMEDAQALQKVAREFDYAPGYDHGPQGVFFGEFLQPPFAEPIVVTNESHTLIKAALIGRNAAGESHGGQALFRKVGSNLELITGQRMPAPGTMPANEFRIFRSLALNSNGNLAFSGDLIEGTIFDLVGIWSNAGGALDLVGRSGIQVPGMPGGVVYGGVGTNVALNSAGKIAFGGGIREPNSASPSKDVVLAGMANALSPIVREGEQAPGTPAGTTFDHFVGPISVDGAGRVLFHGELIGAGIDDTNNEGIWLEDSTSVSLVAREGEQAPTLPTGVDFINLSTPSFNSRGEIALHSRLAGTGIDSTNDGGIWTGTPDSLQLLVQKGDQAPGLPSGGAFTQFPTLALNEAGHLALQGLFPGTVLGGASNHGIWAQDTSGQLQLIVKSGDLIEVAPGDFREVWQLQFGGFNDSGQVVFRASFLSPAFQVTQGIFVSNLVAVPEPNSLLLLFACAATFRHRNYARK